MAVAPVHAGDIVMQEAERRNPASYQTERGSHCSAQRRQSTPIGLAPSLSDFLRALDACPCETAEREAGPERQTEELTLPVVDHRWRRGSSLNPTTARRLGAVG